MESVISKREVPKDLQGITGLTTGFNPPDVQGSRFVITGQPGAGKSTLLNSNPYLLMLDPEQGGESVADPKALRFTPTSDTPPEELDMAYQDFINRIIARKRSGKDDVRMIGIDTLDELISIFQKALCLREKVPDVGDIGGGHGKGYFIVRDAIFGMLDRVHQAGMGWAIIVHTQTKTVVVNGTETQISSLGVSDSYKAAVFKKCSHMLFVEHGITTVKGKEEVRVVKGRRITKPGKSEHIKVRKLKTQPGGLWLGGTSNDIKVRVPLPPEMVLPEKGGWATLATAYDEAVTTLIGANDDA